MSGRTDELRSTLHQTQWDVVDEGENAQDVRILGRRAPFPPLRPASADLRALRPGARRRSSTRWPRRRASPATLGATGMPSTIACGTLLDRRTATS